MPGTSTIFLSHATGDDAFVRALQRTLATFDEEVWIDSRELRGGNPLWSEIQNAIDDAAAFALVISPDSLQSSWVGKELKHALTIQKERPGFRVIPLSLDGTKLGVLEQFFDETPICIDVTSGAGGTEAAIDPILAALGSRPRRDRPPAAQPRTEPLEELVLELEDLKFQEGEGARRPSARARLVYSPATPGQREVESERIWRFVAPTGAIEREELRWYLEKYAVWPSTVFADRARKVEQDLETWGRLLYEAAMSPDRTKNVLTAWNRVDAHASRRFSVEVNATLEEGAADVEVQAARECATLLLGLPWELLHDGASWLFQGAKPVRVRRRLPNTRDLDVQAVSTPIRILLVTARPEDDSCPYIDHRISALPLVEAMEALGGLVQIHVQDPPTLPALRNELDRAREARAPYHVIHFDGHGVYDPHTGLGALCFESPEDIGRLDDREHVLVTTEDLGPLLKDHRIPLVFLEACQTATAESASESVATELLKVGVASVVAMTHSVLVETARRFVQPFYNALAAGKRVGDAMLAGQRALKDDSFRERIFGAGELHLQDWFVPVLFQEKEDPQLFRVTPHPQTQEDFKAALHARVGEVPPEPETGFIGRSRELLALQRLLRGNGNGRYAVIRGQGGEGKTALAAELARWMVRSHQMQRAAFVSVEAHNNAAAVLDALGRQLVAPRYSVAEHGDLEEAILPVERALKEQTTLLVIDNMESVLLPPFVETTEALSEEAENELRAILRLCERLAAIGDTRLVFTSREALPEPFNADHNQRELGRLDREDAVRLVERALNEATADTNRVSDATRSEIEDLVDAVNGHARTLTLLAPSLRTRGVTDTHAALVTLMSRMHAEFPTSREHSLFASVELSLRRMSPANRERVGVLGVFHGGVDLDMLQEMMQWEKEDVDSLAADLVRTGLATPNPYNHLTLDPALSPYVRAQLPEPERETLTARWVEAMGKYAEFLRGQLSGKAEMASTLTLLELPNLFALLDHFQLAGDAQATIALTTKLHSLLEDLGKGRLLARVAEVRDAAAARLGASWSHAGFEAQRTRIQQHLGSGQIQEALNGAQELLRLARAAGESSYPQAAYDLAMSRVLLGRALWAAGSPEQALPLLEEAQPRFEAIDREEPGGGAEGMATVCIMERADCLRSLGRLEEAASAYEVAIRRDAERGAERGVAVGEGQLGTVRLLQRRFEEALATYAKAREIFRRLGEHGTVAVIWHQTGWVYQEAGQPEAAEDAYRKSLTIKVRLGDIRGQASTLHQLGNLYDDVLHRPEEAVAFYRQAADKKVELRDLRSEGTTRNNLAETLRRLGRLEEARREVARAIECSVPFGHAAAIWTSLGVLSDIETAAGNPAAATDARRRAIDAYLAYRRDGGENHYRDGRLALAVTQALLAGDESSPASALAELATNPDLPSWIRPFVHALQSIVAGSRDRTLADDPELAYTMAVEILLLIETLEAPQSGK